MIGTELLNLMFGDPLRQAMAPPQPAPNPNPQAPPAPTRAPSGNPYPLQYDLPHKPTTYTAGPAPGAWTPAPPGPGTLRGPLPGPPAPPGVNVQGGSPMPTGAQGPAPAAPGGPNQPPPAQPQPLPQSGPPSVAPQSPSDLGQLYMQLYNRQRSANEIDRGLSMLAAINSPPSMANAIMRGVGGGDAQDPAQAMNTLMQMRYMQQMYQNLPAAAAALGIDPATAAVLGPQGIQKVAEQKAQSGITLTQQGAEQKQKDFIDAQHAAPAALSQLDAVNSLAGQVIGATDANGKNIMEGITNNAFKRGAAQTMLEDATAEAGKEPGMAERAAHSAQINLALSPEEKAVVNNLIQLRGQVYGEEFKNAGSKRTQSEIKGLVSGASQVFSLNQPFNNYSKQFGAFQNQLHKTYNDTLGEAGRIDEIPENQRWDMSDPNNPKPLVDTAFLPGGDQHHGGGQWASNPPKAQPGGTMVAPVQITGPGDIAKLPKGTPFVIPSGPNQGKIGYAQ